MTSRRTMAPRRIRPALLPGLWLALALTALAEDTVRVPLEQIDRARDAGERALRAEDYAAAVEALALPARAGYKRAQYLYGVALARAGDPERQAEGLGWMVLSIEAGRTPWHRQVDAVLERLAPTQRREVEAIAAALGATHGTEALDMRCRARTDRGSHIKYQRCEHRLRRGQDHLELPAGVVSGD